MLPPFGSVHQFHDWEGNAVPHEGQVNIYYLHAVYAWLIILIRRHHIKILKKTDFGEKENLTAWYLTVRTERSWVLEDEQYVSPGNAASAMVYMYVLLLSNETTFREHRRAAGLTERSSVPSSSPNVLFAWIHLAHYLNRHGEFRSDNDKSDSNNTGQTTKALLSSLSIASTYLFRQ